jgi:hypothetical protein
VTQDPPLLVKDSESLDSFLQQVKNRFSSFEIKHAALVEIQMKADELVKNIVQKAEGRGGPVCSSLGAAMLSEPAHCIPAAGASDHRKRKGYSIMVQLEKALGLKLHQRGPQASMAILTVQPLLVDFAARHCALPTLHALPGHTALLWCSC